jgi:hypothetical protein
VFLLHYVGWQHFRFDKESRGRCTLTSAYDAEGGSQFRTILQVPSTKGYDDACMFGSLPNSQVTAHFRAMHDSSGG